MNHAAYQMLALRRKLFPSLLQRRQTRSLPVLRPVPLVVTDVEAFADDNEVVFPLRRSPERKDKEVVFLPVEDERKDKEVVFLPVDDDEPPPGPPRRATGLRNVPPAPGPKMRGHEDDSRKRRRDPDAAGRRAARSAAALVPGIASLVVGLSQFILCALSPSLGMLSIPITAVGFLLGGSGIVFGLSREGGGKAFSIAGLAVNATAMTVVLLWSLLASAPGSDSASVRPQVPTPVPAPVPAPGAGPDRPRQTAPLSNLTLRPPAPSIPTPDGRGGEPPRRDEVDRRGGTAGRRRPTQEGRRCRH